MEAPKYRIRTHTTKSPEIPLEVIRKAFTPTDHDAGKFNSSKVHGKLINNKK